MCGWDDWLIWFWRVEAEVMEAKGLNFTSLWEELKRLRRTLSGKHKQEVEKEQEDSS